MFLLDLLLNNCWINVSIGGQST